MATPAHNLETDVDAVLRGTRLVRAYRDQSPDQLVEILNSPDHLEDTWSTIFALVLIADRAMRETATVLDVDPDKVLRAAEATTLAYYEDQTSHG